jgi:Fe-S-cluster containining protein
MDIRYSEKCVDCSKTQNTCCQVKIPIAIDDINRIISCGYEKNHFLCVTEHMGNDLLDEDDWWLESFVKINGKFFKLDTKKNEKGQCVFLVDGKGCVLGNNRPYICKVFPFWHENGKISYYSENFCGFERSKVPLEDAMAALGETKEDVIFYCNKIKEDCTTKKKQHEALVKELIDIKK